MKHIILPVVMIFTATAFADTVGDKQLTAKAYVDTELGTKQDKIPAAGKPGVAVGDTVMTYTPGGNGVIGERGIYSDTSNYNANTDGNKLITASALNNVFNSLPTVETSTMICANPPTCTLWTITDDTAYTSCSENQIDIGGGIANCETAKFTLTTTNLAAGDVFSFAMSAKGTFYVDCGADGVLSGTGAVGNTITRTDTTNALYTCTYSSGGVKTIRFGGLATRYATCTYSSRCAAIRFGYQYEDITGVTYTLVAAIDGSLGAIFPTLGQSDNLQPQFSNSFTGCPIQSVPGTLFTGVTGNKAFMFFQTFGACSQLTSIPENLFSGITGSASNLFRNTFWGAGISQIPPNLFAGVTGGAGTMFFRTFYDCTNLSGYIPPSTFAGLISAGAPTATQMWNSTFRDTQLVTTCPTGTTQYTTGYESSWAGKVSCIPN